MIIKSLKVEEGFFSNLNLSFTSGLNVLIGGRGVGKTSIIELLRFGLSSGNLSSDIDDTHGHAISILQSSGRVSIELEQDGRIINVSRSATDKQPIASEPYIQPIVFSQKEIETIGTTPQGRLNLIDSFIPDIREKREKISSLNITLSGHCAQLLQLRKELNELRERTSNLRTLKEREKALIERQESFQRRNQVVSNSEKELSETQNRLANLVVDIDSIASIKQTLQVRINQLQSLLTDLQFPKLHISGTAKINDLLVHTVQSENKSISEAINVNTSALKHVEEAYQYLVAQKLELDSMARQRRSEVESFEEGAGAVLSELGRVKQEIAQLENLNRLVSEKELRLEELYRMCQNILEQIFGLRMSIFESRIAVVEQLNSKLSPVIKTHAISQSNLTFYAESLENVLRGSGLKYKELIPSITEKVAPAWLLYYTHTLNYSDFAATIGIPLDRATRLLAYLNEQNISSILTAKIDDLIDFSLLDNGIYKSVSELSIGQRCTVALSVILENSNRVLIIDQPEDHLDNEFIAQTLIKAIQRRASLTQTILSSHNANIPVLGNATNVVNLDSNGRRGFIKHSGSTENKNIRNVIESIMEGGKEAFRLRSKFYSD